MEKHFQVTWTLSNKRILQVPPNHYPIEEPGRSPRPGVAEGRVFIGNKITWRLTRRNKFSTKPTDILPLIFKVSPSTLSWRTHSSNSKGKSEGSYPSAIALSRSCITTSILLRFLCSLIAKTLRLTTRHNGLRMETRTIQSIVCLRSRYLSSAGTRSTLARKLSIYSPPINLLWIWSALHLLLTTHSISKPKSRISANLLKA